MAGLKRLRRLLMLWRHGTPNQHPAALRRLGLGLCTYVFSAMLLRAPAMASASRLFRFVRRFQNGVPFWFLPAPLLAPQAAPCSRPSHPLTGCPPDAVFGYRVRMDERHRHSLIILRHRASLHRHLSAWQTGTRRSRHRMPASTVAPSQLRSDKHRQTSAG